jgi:hypothetical protein
MGPPLPIDAAELASQSEYLTVAPGAPISPWIEVRNTGTTTWTTSSYGWNGRGELQGWTGYLTRNVAPGETVRFFWNLNAPMTPGVYDYGFMMRNGTQEFGPYFFVRVTVVPTVSLGFQVNRHGYKFPNYPWSFPQTTADFTTEAMMTMFGGNNVCIMIGGRCLIHPVADMWWQQVNASMNGGHCDGMASTSLRFFKGQGVPPGSLQPDAQDAHDLDLLTSVRRHIATFFALQTLDPVMAHREQAIQQTPSQVVSQLQTAISSGADPVTMVLVKPGGGGHVVVPYALEDHGNDLFKVRVYDNNWPDDANRYLTINSTAQTWSYDLGGSLGVWGTATSHKLGVIPISLYGQPPECFWCLSGGENDVSLVTAESQVWLNGSGHLLISDSQGRHIGYVGDQFVDEIPSAYASDILTGLGVVQEPVYSFQGGGGYTILLDGQTVNQPENVSVTQFGPGYAIQVEGVRLTPSVRDNITVSADGSQVTYQPNQNRTPSLSLAVSEIDTGHELKIFGAEISTNQQVSVAAQDATGRLAYSNAQAGGGGYGLFVRRVSEGGVQLFAHNDLTIGSGDTHYADYRNWNGRDSMTLQIDRGSNGTIDETVTLQNQIRSVYLPIVLGN